MKNVFDLFLGSLEKMKTDGSLIFGTISGVVALAVPEWIMSKDFGAQHVVLVGILISIFFMEQMVGSRLAKMSPVKNKRSTTLIDSTIRNVIILMCCMIAYGADYLLSTGSIVFVIFTLAFIYHNFYSLMANLVVLGWGKYFPLWLLYWLSDEIIAKTEKYFPGRKVEVVE